MNWLVVGVSAAGIIAAAAHAQFEHPRYEYCDTAEHQQFDHSVGLWEVYDTDSNDRVADARIEKLAGGCAIVERYMVVRLGTSSISTWRPKERMWRYYAVAGVNDVEVLEGRLVGDVIVFKGTRTTSDGTTLSARISHRPGADGSFRRIIESSADGGKEWLLLSDLTYRRSPADDPPGATGAIAEGHR